ncbi:MAG: hypothetical protein MZW92_35270 [Comamonadaceae bacterium]|nr:hypothetical protein [Comamonadaceae bacterium]
MVGGTMLYAQALREGLIGPAAGRRRGARAHRGAARASSAGRRCTPSWRASTRRPRRGCRPNDSQRIQRALEVFELTGAPLSQLQGAPQRAARCGWRRSRCCPRTAPNCTGASSSASTRCSPPASSTKCGALMARGDLDPDLPALRSVGYRQAWRHLRGETTPARSSAPRRSPPRGSWPSGRSPGCARCTTRVRVDPFADGALESMRKIVADARP